jgi:hypothetical protein
MHNDWWCQGVPELSFPSLHTLRLDLSCESSNLIHTKSQPQSCATCRTTCPKRLVLRRLKPWPRLEPALVPYIDLIERTTDDLVLVFGDFRPLWQSEYQDRLGSLLYPLPKCPAKRITIIF